MKVLDRFVITGDVVSKKNSERIVRFGKVRSIRPSKAYDKYAENAVIQLLTQKRPIKSSFPVMLHFMFYRKTNGPFDYNNMSQGPQDLLVKAGILPDDNMKYVIPVFSGEYAGWIKDKDNPRIEITVTEAI